MKSLIMLSLITSLLQAEEVQLFNGKDLTGWIGDSQYWSVEDSAITGQTSPEKSPEENRFLIWKGGEYSDFTLTFHYKMTPGDEKKYCNSGVQYRSKVIDLEKFIVGGYQADLEYGNTYSGILYEERGRGILAQRGQNVLVKQGANPKKPILEIVGKTGDPAVMESAIKKDDWNEYKIIANGNRIKHFINGHLTVDLVDSTAEAPQSGVIALQIHKGPPMKIQFKDFLLITK